MNPKQEHISGSPKNTARHVRTAGAALLLLLALSAEAQPQGLDYITTNDTITITFYGGPDSDLVIPETIDGLPVTTIGERAFTWTDLYTPLTSITIPQSVTTIGKWAFAYCQSLTNVMVPNAVTNIGEGAFAGCISLNSITVGPLNSKYRSAEGALFNHDVTTLITCPAGQTGRYRVPSTVTNIDTGAFNDCVWLTNVIVTSAVSRIGDYAFSWCTNLPSIILPSSVTSIGAYAFTGCSQLFEAYFLGSPPSVGERAFEINVTAFHLSGATNWGTMLGDIWAAVWPQVQTSDVSFGMRTNGFGFKFQANRYTMISIEAATNLLNPVWEPVETLYLTNDSGYFNDPESSSHPTRFYRIRWL